MKYFTFIVFAVCLPAAVPQPDAQQIIRRSVAANESSWKEAPNYAYVDRDVESKHDGSKTSKTYEVLMIDGSPYHKIVAENDRSLTKVEQAQEDQKLQHEIHKRQHESKRERNKRIAKYMKERNQDHAMMNEMASALTYTLAGQEYLDGHDVWVLDATPKPGYIPKTHDAKVLTGMKGKLWIDKATYQWVKVEAEVFKPVSFYGFIAKVGPGTKFVLEQEPVTADVWLPKHFSMNVNASALGFINEDSTEDDTYRNYRLNPKMTAESTPPR